MEARTRIVLNADDFGLARGIDTAILALLRGRLSGVSAMVSAPWWGADGPRLAPFMATADIGLHFALTEVPTLPAVRRRREDQSPFTFAEVHKAAWTGRIEIDVVLDELRLQWNRFRDVVRQRVASRFPPACAPAAGRASRCAGIPRRPAGRRTSRAHLRRAAAHDPP